MDIVCDSIIVRMRIRVGWPALRGACPFTHLMLLQQKHGCVETQTTSHYSQYYDAGFTARMCMYHTIMYACTGAWA